METNTMAQIQAYCQEITQDGKQLSVSWEGGSDSGCFFLRLDGHELEAQSGVEKDIVDLVDKYLGYGSFDGNFSTDGTVVYHREKKCFTGQDTCFETDYQLCNCAIEFSIPKGIWFDSLLIQVESDDFDYSMMVTISLNIHNGPYPEHFDDFKSRLEPLLEEKFTQAVDHIDNFAGVWHNYTLPRKNSLDSGGMLLFQINELDHYIDTNQVTDICISLQDSPPEEDILETYLNQ